ncbi:MAG: leucine-rich repeat protein [Oscillospiraceae bacterium]|nr:leucine-rich repeat protein [Oscillospiraceae bacterium]
MNKLKAAAMLSAFCIAVSGLPIPECLSAGTVFAAEAAEETADLLKYTVSDGQVTITGTTGNLPEEYTIPAEIEGLPVTVLGKQAFQKQPTLAKLTLPDSLVRIDQAVFYDCDALTAAVIPSSVTEIGNSAFASCGSLAEITLNNGLKTIGSGAFTGAKETELTIPATVETIGDKAFSSNYTLKSVTVPDSVTSLGSGVFSNCSKLESYALPQGMTEIPASSFSGCSALTAITMPDSVTVIGESAFAECEGLTELNIPAQITTIGDKAFYKCESLAVLTLNEGLERIGENAFAKCAALTAVTFPSSLTALGSHAFSETGLTAATIPATVTEIGSGLFDECKELTQLSLPDNMTVIPAHLAGSCNKLESVVIPDGVTEIGKGAFGFCSKLADVQIPASVKEIGGYAFSGTAFVDNLHKDNCFVIINDILISAEGCVGDVTVPDGVRIVAEEAFNDYRNDELTGVTFPDSVIRIDGSALSSIRTLERVTLPKNLQSIGMMAFWGCAKLQSVEIPESVGNNIGNSAFGDCHALESAKLPSDMTVIPDDMFASCNSLKEISFPKGIKSIGNFAFSRCEGLTALNLPDGLETIGTNAFYKCNSLTEVTLPESVTSIGTGCFGECLTLGSLTVLNPYCEIPDNKDVIYTSDKSAKPPFSGIIHGYDNSTAQKHAEKYGIVFESLGAAPAYITTAPPVTTTAATTTTVTTAAATTKAAAVTTTVRITAPKPVITTAPAVKTTAAPAATTAKLTSAVTASAVSTTTVTTTTVQNYNGLRYSVHYDWNDKEKEHPTISINGFIDSMPHDVEVPSEIDGIPVTDIGGFYKCDRLHSIYIPDGVTISSRTFEDCHYLESVRLPADLKKIDQDTFKNCYSLKQVNIPETVTEIESYAFWNCHVLSSMTLPKNLEKLSSLAFVGCWELTPIAVPEGVKDKEYGEVNPLYMGNYYSKSVICNNGKLARSNASMQEFINLEELIFTDKVTDVEAAMIAQNATLRRVVFLNPECTIKVKGDEKYRSLNEICGYAGSPAEEYAKELNIKFTAITDDGKVPALADRTDDYNLQYLSYVTRGDEIVISNISESWPYPREITIPEKIEGKPVVEIALSSSTSIPRDLFVLNIPKTVNKIDLKWFPYNESLQQINVDPANETFCSVDGVLFNKDKTELIYYPSDRVCSVYEIPDTVKAIGEMAFAHNSYPAYVKFPTGLEKIDKFAFMDSPLFSADLSATKVTEMGQNTFEVCANLEELQLPATLEKVPYAMCKKTNLKSIVLPDSVKSIGDGAFSTCKNLTSVTLNKDLEKIDNGAFANCISLEKIVLPEKVEYIENSLFYCCTNLKSVTALNPQCRIADDPDAICNEEKRNETTRENEAYFYGVIRGYTGTKLEEFANKYGYRFESIGGIPAAGTTATIADVTAVNVTTATTAKVTQAPLATKSPNPYTTEAPVTTKAVTATAAVPKTAAPSVTTTAVPKTATPSVTTTAVPKTAAPPVTTVAVPETTFVALKTTAVPATTTAVPVTTTAASPATTTTSAASVPPKTTAGDMNGDGVVKIDDVVLFTKLIGEVLPDTDIPSAEALEAADLDGDGLLTLMDIRLILKKIFS